MIVLSIELKGEENRGWREGGTLYVGQFMGFPGSASRRLLESVPKKKNRFTFIVMVLFRRLFIAIDWIVCNRKKMIRLHLAEIRLLYNIL